VEVESSFAGNHQPSFGLVVGKELFMNKQTPLLLSLLVLSTLACNNDEHKAKSAPAKASKTVVKTAKKAVPAPTKAKAMDATEALKAYWAADAARDEAALSAFIDDKSVVTMVDHTPPMTHTGADIVKMNKMHWSAFSSMKTTPQLVLSSGQNIAAIRHFEGVNDGSMMGMPATNKTMALFAAELVTMTPEGKISSERWWMDQATAAHQMGMFPSKRAPDADKAWDASKVQWIKAEHNDAEKANLALAQKLAESLVNKDVDAYMEQVADDVSFRYVGEKEGVKGKAEYKKGLAMWMTMADHKGMVTEAWAAGDWVVSVEDMVSTMKMDMPGTKETKGKEVKSNLISFYQFNEGKLQSHWIFENSMNYAVQLGLMPPMKGMKHGMKHNMKDMKHNMKDMKHSK